VQVWRVVVLVQLRGLEQQDLVQQQQQLWHQPQ
jgi:hypothetical protein